MGQWADIIDSAVLRELTDDAVVVIDIGPRGARGRSRARISARVVTEDHGAAPKTICHTLREDLMAHRPGASPSSPAPRWMLRDAEVKAIVDLGGRDSQAVKVDACNGKVMPTKIRKPIDRLTTGATA